jgi:hypothetical protein
MAEKEREKRAMARREPRTVASNRIELVTVYRDRRDMLYDQAVIQARELPDFYTIFSVVAVLRDASSAGIGISFEGQQLMSRNILRPGERYLLRLTLPAMDIPASLTPFVQSEGSYFFLMLKATCRWYKPSARLSTAGFALLDTNPPEVVDFVSRHLKEE